MLSLFSRVFRQARVTFEPANGDKFLADLQTLKSLVVQMSLADLNINPAVVASETFQAPDKAPCTFIEIYEGNLFTMSVFVLRENYTMPLHDHPKMHGILRVISGAVKIRSFSEISRSVKKRKGVPVQQILTAAEPEKIVTAEPGECVQLTPSERNFHEITAIGGPAAFFDILSPPYNLNMEDQNRRLCSYYRPVPKSADQQDGGETNLITLEQIANPVDYYCDTVPFEPPDFMAN